MESGQRVRRVSLPAPISPSYNFANPATTNQGGPARKVSVRPGSIFERLGAEERKLSVIWARHTPGRENLTMSSSHHYTQQTRYKDQFYDLLTLQMLFMILGMLNKFSRLNDQH